MLELIFTLIKHLCTVVHLYGILFAPIFTSGDIWDKLALYLMQIDVANAPLKDDI